MGRTLFLVGFMASGKSSLGKKIAQHFNMEFLDLDNYIEAQENKTITQIFETLGEEKFRELEAKYLREINLNEKIIATGGGTPIFHKNMVFMKENGAVVYLVVPAEIIIGRLRQNKEKRPLVKDLSDEELVDFVEKTLAIRRVIYSAADILVPHTKSWTLLKMELGFLLE